MPGVMLLMNRTVEIPKASLLIACLNFLFISASLVLAQENKTKAPDLRGIPYNLQPSLLERIREFTEAQRNGEWEKIPALLGEFRDNSYRRRYTDEHRQCLIEQMKSSPMVSFVPSGAGISTETLSKPLSRKWWYIRGEAKFRNDGQDVKGQATIVAYRYSGQWFLTPPNYDDEWKRTKISTEDLAADLSKYLKVEVPPDCPLEIMNLSVKIHPNYRSLRQVTFNVRNKSRKNVDGLGFRIEKMDRSGSMSSGTSLEIKAGEIVHSPDNITYSAYVYYCEGESYNRFIIDWVRFADGTRWKKTNKRRSR